MAIDSVVREIAATAFRRTTRTKRRTKGAIRIRGTFADSLLPPLLPRPSARPNVSFRGSVKKREASRAVSSARDSFAGTTARGTRSEIVALVYASVMHARLLSANNMQSPSNVCGASRHTSVRR